MDSSTGNHESSEGAERSPLGERLDSWKSIAAYLGREVRTIQRWEKAENLPIHRHQHAKLGSVYAYTAELKEWRHSRRITVLKEEEDASPREATDLKEAVPNQPATVQASAVRPPTVFVGFWTWKRLAAAAGICCLLGLLPFLPLERHNAPAFYNPLPLTTDEGWQSSPSLSPDGASVVYAWKRMDEPRPDLYTEVIGSSKPIRLTTTPGDAFRPAWSPDGQWIAFLRSGKDGRTELWIHSVLKKNEWCIRQLEGDYDPEDRTLSWTPDSEGLIVPTYSFALKSGGLYYLPLKSNAAEVRLTEPSSGQGDSNSAISPDGRQLIFTRFFSSGVSHLCVLELSADHRPISPEKIVDWSGFAAFSSTSPAFWGSSGDLLFVSNRNGVQIWRSHNLEPPQVTGLPAGHILNFAISERSHRLVYSLDRSNATIWRINSNELLAKKPTQPERIIASTEIDRRPQVSSDGKQVVFESNRSGAFEIWKNDLRTGESFQVTHLRHLGSGSPVLSPDSKEIAFDSRFEGKADIYKVSPAGGIPTRLAHDGGTGMLPTWSNDRRWIYFSSNRSGMPQIWRVPANGGPAEQITSHGGLDSRMSPDGSYLYFTQEFKERSVWRVPPSGGLETKIVDTTVLRGFAVASKGLFYVGPVAPRGEELRYFDLATKMTQPLFVFPRKIIPPISSDGKFVYFSQYEQITSNLMILEDFR